MPPPEPPPSPKFSADLPRPLLGKAPAAVSPAADSPSASAGLSHTMARIHSRKETDAAASSSASSLPAGAASSFLAKVSVSPPEADSLFADKKTQTARERVIDPVPGPLGAALWFWFRFGRYANAMLPEVSSPRLMAWMALSGAGLLLVARGLVALDPGPLSVFTSPFFLLQCGVWSAGALGLPLLLTGLLFVGARFTEGALSFEQAWRIGLGALVPLASIASVAFLLGVLSGGESFWRGYTPKAVAVMELFLLPAAVFWVFLRSGQAMVRTGLSIPLRTFGALLPLGAVLALLSLWPIWRARPTEQQQQLFEQAMDSSLLAYAGGDPLAGVPAVEEGLRKLPRRALVERSELILRRLELQAAGGRIFEARADAERLRRMFPPHAARNRLARGINLVLLERPDLGIPHLERALMMQGDLDAAHRWLALIRMEKQPAAALEHARQAWQVRPDLLHLRIVVDALYRQENYAEIWKTLAGVYQDPQQWFPLTLLQGGMAAAKTGNPIRARSLLRRARERDPSLTQDLPASLFE